MSTELTLYCKSATPKVLREILTDLGFRATSSLTGSRGNRSFMWFEDSNWQSTVGVEANIIRPDRANQDRFKGGSWALHTRSRAGRSHFDALQQNLVIREARKRFGGSFYNDWAGVNRYIPIEADAQGPIGRALAYGYYTATDRLAMLEVALPEERMGDAIRSAADNLALASMFKLLDPVRVLYSSLVPAVIAALEFFFRHSFSILLRYEPKVSERLARETRRVDFSDALALSTGAKRIEDVVSSWYSFQSLDGIHVAFRDWFQIDFRSLLRSTKDDGANVRMLEHQMREAIEYRHGVIHGFRMDPETMGHAEFVEIAATAIATIDAFVDYLQEERHLVIRG